MAIVSSVIVCATPQKDGRRNVVERHLDEHSAEYLVAYVADALTDVVVAMTARAPLLYAQRTNAEISDNVSAIMALGSLFAPTLNYSTALQNAAALRIAYQTATQMQAIMIGDFLSTLTDAQLQNLFALTAAQVTTLRTNKLTPAATAAATIRINTGA